MVGAGLYHSLSQGLKVWQRTQGFAAVEDVALAFEKMTVDLRNSFVYSLIQFEGTKNRFSFPTIAHGQDDQIGQVEYYFDAAAYGFYRRQADYSQARQGQFGAPKLLIKSLIQVKFHYYYLTDKEEIISETAREVFPSAVEVEIVVMDQGEPRVLRKLIDIPWS